MTLPAGVIQAGVPRAAQPRRVFAFGATGTIGRATVRALVRRGHDATLGVLRTGGRVLRALAAKAD